MAVCAVYENQNSTVVYNDRGAQIYHYGRRHDGSSASGNSVLIDASESDGFMELITFDDDGKYLRSVNLPPRRRY